MPRPFTMRRKLVLAGLAVCALAVVLGWTQRSRLLARYYVYRLVRAPEQDRETWVERTASLEAAALPALLAALRDDDPFVCTHAQAALARLLQCEGPDEGLVPHILDGLAGDFAARSPAGQIATLDVAIEFLARVPQALSSRSIAQGMVGILGEGTRAAEAWVHERALALAVQLAGQSDQPDILAACRETVRAGLQDKDPAQRTRAVRAALRLGRDVLGDVVPLLDDTVPEVRRAAILAVGPAPEVLATDDLLRWLHDADAEVSALCEQALRGRGLRDHHLRLGRLMTDARPGARLQVLDLLRRTQDLEPGVWLRRMSHDPSPAVRAAAVRAAGEVAVVDLSDRIEQMTQNDPSSTVRQLAQYYLSARKSRSMQPLRAGD